MKLQFVTAEESDIPVIVTLAKALINAYEDLESIDYEKVLLWVSRKISGNISQYRCVLCDGQKCAYYRLCEGGELDDLYVLPEFQNIGIGTRILRKCLEESENPLYLYVFSRNTRAIAFYERFGFVVSETVSDTRFIMALKG